MAIEQNSACGSACRAFLLFLAFQCALFPTVIKVYETSHWFRENGDPSTYDEFKDYFAEGVPFAHWVEDGKKMMRVYFFIIPYFVSGLLVWIAGLLFHEEPPLQMLTSARKLGYCCTHRTFDFPEFLVVMGFPQRISFGEIMGVLIFLAFQIATFYVRVHRSLGRGTRKLTFLYDDGDTGRDRIPVDSWEQIEISSKTLGVLAIMNLGWYLIMPMGKRSIALKALGMPWEMALKYHRWVGFYTAWVFALHSFGYFALWIHMGELGKQLDGCGFRSSGCGDGSDEDLNFLSRMNWWGVINLFILAAITFTSWSWVRRSTFKWGFELFFYVHHLFALSIIFTCLHYGGSIIYLVPGIAFYLLDKIIGLFSYWKKGQVRAFLRTKDVIEIHVQLEPGASYKAGEYIYLNVPEVDNIQWHPYSITSSPAIEPDRLIFHLKDEGDWTKEVIELCSASDHNGFLDVRIDGMYGHDIALFEVNCVHAVFVGGGIGVTPMFSAAFQATVPSEFFWITRSVEEFRGFEGFLFQLHDMGANVKCWITLSKSKLSPEEAMEAILKERDTIPTLDLPVDLYTYSSAYFSDCSHALLSTMLVLLGVLFFSLSVVWFEEDKTDPAAWWTLVVISIAICFTVLWFMGIASIMNPSQPSNELITGSENIRTKARDDREAVLRQWLDDRIGCRPDLKQEFVQIGDQVVADDDYDPLEPYQHQKFFDVQVMACGSLPMIDTIDELCNKPHDYFPENVDFHFTEEDWEW